MESVPKESQSVGAGDGDDRVAERVELVGVADRLARFVGRALAALVDEVALLELHPAKSIHPGGNPIIQRTNEGLRCPAPVPVGAPGVGELGEDCPSGVGDWVSIFRTTTSVSVAPLLRPLSAVQFPAVPLAFASVAVGVGKSPRWARFAISVGSWLARPGPLWSRATGVGSIPRFTASTSVGPSLPSLSGIDRGPLVASEARGVGSLASAANLPPPRFGLRCASALLLLKSLACGVGSIARSFSVPRF